MQKSILEHTKEKEERMKTMLTIDLIENRINHFWGYGNLQSDIWFVGMEEGFHGSLEDLNNRFQKTKNKNVIDIKDDMIGVKDHIKWFNNNSNLQKTWHKLIFILLTLRSKENTAIDDLKHFQRNEFARLNSDHCSLEFMPLPSKSVNPRDWMYKQFGVDYLKNRKEYTKKIMPLRISLFKKIISQYKPKIIIFYSLSYLDKWKEIIGKSSIIHSKEIYYSKNNESVANASAASEIPPGNTNEGIFAHAGSLKIVVAVSLPIFGTPNPYIAFRPPL